MRAVVVSNVRNDVVTISSTALPPNIPNIPYQAHSNIPLRLNGLVSTAFFRALIGCITLTVCSRCGIRDETTKLVLLSCTK